MPRSTVVSFTPIQFLDDLPPLHRIETRLVTFLENWRNRRSTDKGLLLPVDQPLSHTQRSRIHSRARLKVARSRTASGIAHLKREDCDALAPLRGS